MALSRSVVGCMSNLQSDKPARRHGFKAQTRQQNCHEIISMAVLSKMLIQAEQLSVNDDVGPQDFYVPAQKMQNWHPLWKIALD